MPQTFPQRLLWPLLWFNFFSLLVIVKTVQSSISWVLQVVSAVILGQTLYFKFSGHPESVALFSELGMEPQGRLLIGVLELVAVAMLLYPATIVWGALLTVCLMMGATIAHITHIGFEGEAGILWAMGFGALLSSVAILFLRREKVPFIASMFAQQASVASETDD